MNTKLGTDMEKLIESGVKLVLEKSNHCEVFTSSFTDITAQEMAERNGWKLKELEGGVFIFSR